MNIFVTNDHPVKAAQDLPDKLVVKMPTESMQMLAYWTSSRGHTCYRYDGQHTLPYKTTKSQANHPCTKWVLESPHNGVWLYIHAHALCQEYAKRYGKTHAIEASLFQVWDFISSQWDIVISASWEKHTPFNLCMPDEYKSSDPVQSYRDFMIGEKGYAEWRYCAPPDWWDEGRFAPTRRKYYEALAARKQARDSKKKENQFIKGILLSLLFEPVIKPSL